MSAKTFLEGCGIGIALTLSYTWQPLAPAHIDGLYLRVLPVSSVAGGAALDLVAASFLSWGVLALLERFDKTRKTLLWALLAAVVPAILIRSALSLAEVNFAIPSTLAMAGGLFLPAVLVWRFWPTGYRRLVGAFRWACLCMGVCILWMLPELADGALQRQPLDATETHRQMGASAPRSDGAQTRVVWLLLDELSYDQTFDHRHAGLNLANFDALRAQSTSFADVEPAGYFTDVVLPAVLSGRPVTEIASSLDGALRVRGPSGGWQPFDPQETLFGDAERQGWSTGIAGWFNPYCRLFATVVDSCLWEPGSRMFPGHMNAANTAWQNALAPVGSKFHARADTLTSAEHGRSYRLLLDRGLDLVREGRERFVFVHLPVPHPPGIYNRMSGQMRIGGSYLDNLALADRTVGVVRAAIEESAAAGNTILIVSSDHSMRVPMWRGGPSWTAEDERVIGKRFDPRPVLLVHFPGEQTGSMVTAPFAEVRTHDLMDEMFTGKIDSEAGLAGWLAADESVSTR